MKKSTSGFTIVELLIVIVVIAILAAITIVAFNGVQDRAHSSAMRSGLSQAVKKVKLYMVDNGEDYPPDLVSAGITGDDSTTFQYSVNNNVNPKTFCITASNNGATEYVDHAGTIGDGMCSGHYANMSPPLSNWTTGGSTTYDTSSGEIRLNSAAGYASSPKIKINGASKARITVNVLATLPSPNGSPNSRAHFASAYYASDASTPVTNTSGYTGNGDAACVVTLSVWRSCTWTTVAGPNVIYILFQLSSSPSAYTSDNRYKNVQIMAIP